MNSGDQAARRIMVNSQINAFNVFSKSVLEVMDTIPREPFFSESLSPLVYSESSLPIGNGWNSMAPAMVGQILQALAIENNDKTLVVGFGSGYIAGCLSQLGCQVVGMDSESSFLQPCKKAMDNLQLPFNELITLDAKEAVSTFGEQSFNVVAVCGAIHNTYIDYFFKLLMPKGRLFCFVGEQEDPVLDGKIITKIDDYGKEELLLNSRISFLNGFAN